MKKLVVLLLVFLLLPLQACSQEMWKKGKHYVEMPLPVSQEKKVTEIFSFWCPHCFYMEDFVGQLKPQLTEGVAFEKVHISSMPGRSQDIQNNLTQAMLIAREMGVEDKFNKAVFDQIHKYKGSVNSQKDLANLFIVNGLDVEAFDKQFGSEEILAKLTENNRFITERGQFVKGVPTFIVNNKYLVTFTRDMNAQDRFDLINWLTELN